MSTFSNAIVAVQFMSGNYEDAKGRIVTFPEIKLESALVTVSQAKKIINTEIDGQDGTVTEYIGMGDYEVNLNGIFTGANGVEPIQQKIDLKKMLDAPIPIDVVCPQLQTLGIHQVIVTNYEIPQDEGGISYQRFSISFISHIPKILKISNV